MLIVPAGHLALGYTYVRNYAERTITRSPRRMLLPPRLSRRYYSL